MHKFFKWTYSIVIRAITEVVVMVLATWLYKIGEDVVEGFKANRQRKEEDE